MLIEVRGVQFVNKGAELMLHAVMQQMQRHWPEAKLVLYPTPNSPYYARAAVGALQLFPLRKGRFDLTFLAKLVPVKIRRWLQFNLGIVFSVDIEVVLDASGFAYGDQWPASNSKALCADIQRFAAVHKAYIILPQALGPFSRVEEISRLKRYLPKAALICAREKSSYDYVVSLIGAAENLCLFPDFTNLVSGIVPAYYQDGDTKILIIPNANMISSRSNQNGWRDTYVNVLLNAITAIRAMGCKPVLLNHEGQADGDICAMVQQRSGVEPIELITEQDPLQVKGIIGASRAVICSRFHGCVSALSQGVPCLGTSWSHKYERLFEEYGQSDALLSADTSAEQLQQKLLQVIDNVASADLVAKRELLVQQSELMWQQVVAVVRQKLTI